MSSSKWIKAVDLLKKYKLVGNKPELNKEKEFKQLIEILNTTTYRTKYKTQKLRANSLMRSGGLMDKNSYFFMKGDSRTAFDKIKVISNPRDSASDSVVIVLVKGKQQFVMKLTFVPKEYAVEYNAPDTEARFYSIMETLVKKKITPHVFTLTDCLWENIDRTKIEPNFNKYLSNFNAYKPYVYPILTETGNADSELITLFNLLRMLPKKYNYSNLGESLIVSKILLNIIFQIVYTLLCFERIDIKHNDLHTGNVFILKRRLNLLDKPSMPEQFKRRYTYVLSDGTKKSVLLENIGLDVRIFDFDRGVKQKNNFRYYPEPLKSRFLSKYFSFGQNDLNNPYADLYKIIMHIRLGHGCTREVKDILDTIFIQRSLLLDQRYKDKSGRYVSAVVPGYKSYNLLTKSLPDGVMMRNEQVLDLLTTHVNAEYISKNKNVFESFTTENIVESEKERVMKTIKAREAAKKATSAKVTSPKVTSSKAASPKAASAKASSPKKLPVKKKSELVKCDDKTTRRSAIKTKKTNKDGKIRKRKMIDSDLKNCIFPFKFKKQMHEKCFDDGDGAICATERKPNCAIEKYAYCQ